MTVATTPLLAGRIAADCRGGTPRLRGPRRDRWTKPGSRVRARLCSAVRSPQAEEEIGRRSKPGAARPARPVRTVISTWPVASSFTPADRPSHGSSRKLECTPRQPLASRRGLPGFCALVGREAGLGQTKLPGMNERPPWLASFASTPLRLGIDRQEANLFVHRAPLGASRRAPRSPSRASPAPALRRSRSAAFRALRLAARTSST